MIFLKIATVLQTVFFLDIVTATEQPPIVDLPNLGKIEGGYGSTVNQRTFYSFEGVPYARPPVGKYRFKEPVPIKPWNGIWKAKTMYKCMQFTEDLRPGEDRIIGDEDCLYLNIYTPTLDPKANLDVMVYIHGGAFMYLYGGFYGPQYILDKNIVYVNLNYRLGPLGFLSTEDPTVPGNNGLRDQNLALLFVQEYVQHFGGNPDSVTISGMSAGGASVHLHYLSPRSRGLFHRGISQSGTALNPWVLTEAPLEKSKKLADNVGCTTGNVREMVDCLRRRPARQIVGSVEVLQPWLYNPFSPFGVVVDGWAADPFLPEHPLSLLRKKKVSDVPWIASETDAEGLYNAAEYLMDEEKNLKDINERWNEIVPFILDYNYTVDPKLRDEVSEKIRREYLGEEKLTRENFNDFVRILSDRMFVVDIEKTAKLQSSVVTSPVYFYYFTYRGADSWHQPLIGRQDDFGAAHAEDTAFIYKTLAETYTTQEDKEMVKIFVDMFTSLAKNGEPQVPVVWKPLSKNVKDPLKCLKIDSPKKIAMKTENWSNEKFWKSLPIFENEKFIKNVLKDEL